MSGIPVPKLRQLCVGQFWEGMRVFCPGRRRRRPYHFRSLFSLFEGSPRDPDRPRFTEHDESQLEVATHRLTYCVTGKVDSLVLNLGCLSVVSQLPVSVSIKFRYFVTFFPFPLFQKMVPKPVSKLGQRDRVDNT